MTIATNKATKVDSYQQKLDHEAYFWTKLNQDYGITPNSWERYKSDHFRSKNDNAMTLFAGRVLEILSPRLVYQDLPPLWTRDLLPIRATLPAVHLNETVTYTSFRGKPVFTTGVSNASPKVAYVLDRQSHKTALFKLGMDVTFQELRTIAFANTSSLFPFSFNLMQEKLGAVTRGLFEFEHFTHCYGDAVEGLNGMLNHPDVPIVDSVGVFNPYSVLPNQADLLNQWFTLTLLEALQANTNELVRVNGILIPTKLKNKLNTTYLGDTGITAMKLVEDSLETMNITSVVELKTDYLEEYGVKTVGDNEHRLVLGEFTADTIDCAVSQIVDDPWTDMSGGREKFYIKAIRSVIMRKPEKMLYVDFANA